MGTDGCGSIEGTDMQNALYLSALLQKLRGDHAGWVGATEAFYAATMAAPARSAASASSALSRSAASPISSATGSTPYPSPRSTMR